MRSLGVGSVLLLAFVGCAGRALVPQAPHPALEEGDRLRRAGRTEDAVEAYRRAIESEPRSTRAHLRLVEAFLADGRANEARTLYAARASSPAATTADRALRDRLASDGSTASLRAVYEEAARQEPASAWWPLALAEVELGSAFEEDARRRAAVARGDRDAERAAADARRASFARADEALRRARALDPASPETDLDLGHLRAAEGDLELGSSARRAAYREAEAAFVRAVRRAPDLVPAWEGLGDVRLRSDDPRGALEACLAAARLAPEDGRIRLAVGVALHRIGRFDEAAEQYQAAALLLPSDADPWLRLGDARADAERWDAALVAYDEALRRDPAEAEAHFRAASVLEQLGRGTEARVRYERYLALGGAREGTAQRRIERIVKASAGSGGR